MADSMVEKVARAICSQQRERQFWQDFEPAARAAIAAMREPSGRMKDAGAETYGAVTGLTTLPIDVLVGQPTKAYAAMIDAAINE